MSLMTVQDLIDRVVSDIDDGNRHLLDPVKDILPALQQGWEDATDIIANRLDDLLQTYVVLPKSEMHIQKANSLGTQDEQRYLLTPEDCYQQRVTDLEWRAQTDDWWRPISLVNPNEAYQHELAVFLPVVSYQIARYHVGRKIYLAPFQTADKATMFRMRYIRRPAPLVMPQGRISAWDVVSGTITVDAVGGGVSTLDDTDGNYISIIDGGTGLVTSTHRVLSKTVRQVIIDPAPTRLYYRDRDVTGVLPDTINYDDYICIAPGSCVPMIEAPVTTFVIAYAVSKMGKKLRLESASSTDAALTQFEKKVDGLAHNRPARFRVKMSAPWSSRK